MSQIDGRVAGAAAQDRDVSDVEAGIYADGISFRLAMKYMLIGHGLGMKAQGANQVLGMLRDGKVNTPPEALINNGEDDEDDDGPPAE